MPLRPTVRRTSCAPGPGLTIDFSAVFMRLAEPKPHFDPVNVLLALLYWPGPGKNLSGPSSRPNRLDPPPKLELGALAFVLSGCGSVYLHGAGHAPFFSSRTAGVSKIAGT